MAASCLIHNVCFVVLVISLGLRMLPVHEVSLNEGSVSQNENYGKLNKEANQLGSD